MSYKIIDNTSEHVLFSCWYLLILQEWLWMGLSHLSRSKYLYTFSPWRLESFSLNLWFLVPSSTYALYFCSEIYVMIFHIQIPFPNTDWFIFHLNWFSDGLSKSESPTRLLLFLYVSKLYIDGFTFDYSALFFLRTFQHSAHYQTIILSILLSLDLTDFLEFCGRTYHN